jgi:hypothetical protein
MTCRPCKPQRAGGSCVRLAAAGLPEGGYQNRTLDLAASIRRPPNGVSHHRPGERPNTDLSSGRYKTRLVFPRLVLRQKGARKCGLNSCVRHCAQAAGGPQSDYAVVSLVRERGTVTVRSRLGWEWVCLCQNCCHVCASGEWFITLERPRTFADARGGLRF